MRRGRQPQRLVPVAPIMLVWSGQPKQTITMKSVNMLEAKTHLSKLVERIETGRAKEVVIARNGRPVARLVPVQRAAVGQRIGLLKNRFRAPSLEKLDGSNNEIARLFGGA